MAQQARAVAQGALAGQIVGDGIEGLELRVYAFGAVGVGEMRHQRNLFNLRQGVQARPGGAVALGRKAQAVHAGVHLEKHAVRQLGLVRRQHVDLLVAVDGVPQAQARAQLQVARLKAAFQQQNRPAPVERAQALRLGQVQQRKAVGAAQAFKGPFNAMAVGIGLDDGPDPRVRCGGARAREVVGERCGVNGGKNGTWHGKK